MKIGAYIIEYGIKEVGNAKDRKLSNETDISS